MKKFILLPALAITFTVSGQAFFNPLNIPPALSGTNFSLTAAPSTHSFYNAINTPTYGINGSYLGPTLFMNRGDSVTIAVTNNLNQSTTMHWHGMHVPAWTDGGPHTVIPSATTFQVGFKVLNAASTCWYHPHLHQNTGTQVYMGLAGMIIVKDTIEAQLNLPRSYGVDDFPVVLQDRSFNANGTFNVEALADSMIVNGTANAYLDCPAQVVRMRLLNGSNVRSYNLGFSDNRNFYVLASDGGLLSQPFLTNRLKISGGERYEILVDLGSSLGNSFFLTSYASQLGNNEPGGGGMANGNSPLNAVDFPIMQINVVAPTANPVTQIPASLISVTPWLPANANFSRYKTIDGNGMFTNMGNFTFNNLPFDMMYINDTIPLNNTEIWQFTNNSNLAHPIHIHDVPFYILSRNGNSPPAYESGLKDVFYIMPNEIVRVIMKFEDYADDSIPYMYHCHNLMHEDNGMMAQFIVVSPLNSVQENQPATGGISVFPNPAADEFHLKIINASPASPVRVWIYDVLGRAVFSITTTDQDILLNTANWNDGVYAITLVNGEKILKRKIVVSHLQQL